MAKTFQLDVLTPERLFYSGPAEAITIQGLNGELTVLADHIHMVAPLQVGSIRIKKDGAWREAFNSEGFLEVMKQGVVVYVQACEWPEDIDVVRAEAALRRAEERLRQRRSINEYKGSRIAVARAMARLRVTHQKLNVD